MWGSYWVASKLWHVLRWRLKESSDGETLMAVDIWFQIWGTVDKVRLSVWYGTWRIQQRQADIACKSPEWNPSLSLLQGFSSKKWNFRTKFLENFRTLLSVSRGSRHRKCTLFCAINVNHWSSIAVLTRSSAVAGRPCDAKACQR